VTSRLRAFLLPALPVARVVVLRRLVYAFVLLDVLWLHHTGEYHAYADPVWYEPLVAGRWLALPAASVPLVLAVKWTCVVASGVALSGRLPRLAGWTVALSWAWFQYIAFSYGKVDHDRADFAVALLLLPTLASASSHDRRRSEAAGFVLRAVQLTAIATYFFSAWAKLRFGGIDWVDSATMARAVVRRGTPVGKLFLDWPWTLHAFQYVLMITELSAPLIFFVAERWRRRMVYGWFVFHASVYATITIAFWPHLVMMLAFLPLEEYRDRLVGWWRRQRAGSPVIAGDSAAGEPTDGEPADGEPVDGDSAAGDGSAQASVAPGSR
jgi:hypothetical protein